MRQRQDADGECSGSTPASGVVNHALAVDIVT